MTTVVKVKRKRCHFATCTKRLTLTDTACVCKCIFCTKHRLPEQHDCSGNYRGSGPKVEGCKRDKVIKI